MSRSANRGGFFLVKEYIIYIFRKCYCFLRSGVINYQQSRREPDRKKRFMTHIANAAEYRYFSFTGYFYGKASFGLAQQG